MSLKPALLILSFKVFELCKFKTWEVLKFRTLQVMKLRGVLERGRASKMGNLTGPTKHNFRNF